MGEPENRLKKLILDYLHSLGHEAWNTNVGKTRGHYKTGKTGLLDINGYHRKTGVAIFVEVKVGGNKLSSEQICFIFNARRAGCIALKAESLADVLNDKRLLDR